MWERTETLAGELLAGSAPLREAARSSPELPRLRAGSRTFRLDGGPELYLVEGDLLLDSDELAVYALRRSVATGRVAVPDPVPSVPLEPTAALTGFAADGEVVRWDPGHVLRYCVFRASFPDDESYRTVRANVAAAAADWSATCDVAFEHDTRWDTHADPGVALDTLDPDLVFAVRYVDAHGLFIASAFFPTSPAPRRRVLIDPSYYTPDLRFDLVGVLRHELGHVLGFRHEHIRSGAPAECPPEDGPPLVPLTEYDPRSVMHYFCGGVGSTEMAITELDRAGAQSLYGPPRSADEDQVPPPADGGGDCADGEV